MLRFIKAAKPVTSASLVAGVGIVVGLSPAARADVRLIGSGATFPQPLYERWVAEYQKAHPDVRIDYGGGGSGKGIGDITAKIVDFAGSDAPLAKTELAKLGADNVVEIPSCAGGVVPAYNVPGVDQDLKFDGDTLAQIYTGKITKWNDPKLAALNPGVSLPDLNITPAWRSDGSGTNFVWTSYLAGQSEDFKGSVGMGKQVQWPLGQGGKGNPGVAAVVQQTAGAIGYVEQNYADKNNIKYGLVKSKDGDFVKASPQTVSAAGDAAAKSLGEGTVLKTNLWNQSGKDAYPIASFTYLIVYKDLNNVRSKEQAQALVDFLYWAEHDGQKLAPDLDYAPLSSAVTEKIDKALGEITYKGEPVKPQSMSMAK